jgi:hypothetical protein
MKYKKDTYIHNFNNNVQHHFLKWSEPGSLDKKGHHLLLNKTWNLLPSCLSNEPGTELTFLQESADTLVLIYVARGHSCIYFFALGIDISWVKITLTRLLPVTPCFAAIYIMVVKIGNII